MASQADGSQLELVPVSLAVVNSQLARLEVKDKLLRGAQYFARMCGGILLESSDPASKELYKQIKLVQGLLGDSRRTFRWFKELAVIPTIPSEFKKKSEFDRTLGVASKTLLVAFLLTDRVLWLQKLGLVRRDSKPADTLKLCMKFFTLMHLVNFAMAYKKYRQEVALQGEIGHNAEQESAQLQLAVKSLLLAVQGLHNSGWFETHDSFVGALGVVTCGMDMYGFVCYVAASNEGQAGMTDNSVVNMWPQSPGGPPTGNNNRDGQRGGGGAWPPQGEEPALHQFRNMQQAPQPPPAAFAAMMAMGKGFYGKGKGWPGKGKGFGKGYPPTTGSHPTPPTREQHVKPHMPDHSHQGNAGPYDRMMPPQPSPQQPDPNASVFHYQNKGGGSHYDKHLGGANKITQPHVLQANLQHQAATTGGYGAEGGSISGPTHVGSSIQQENLQMIGLQRTKELRPGTELRLVLAPLPSTDPGATKEGAVVLKAHSKVPDTFASAEIFGKELVLGNEYVIRPGSQLAVYTWHGCCVELRGSTVQEYDATNATMPHYFSVASIIEQRRKRATELGTAMCPPPRVLVCGSAASGKSTLAYMLANFALRKHRRPIFVELDPRCTGSFRELPHLPGTINATILDSSCYEFDREPTATYKISQPPKDLNSFEAVQAGGTMDQLSNRLGRSLWYFYGYKHWTDNPQVYTWWCKVLAETVKSRLKHAAVQPSTGSGIEKMSGGPKNIARSGLIINAPAEPSTELLKTIISAYEVDIVLVLDDNELYQDLASYYGDDAAGDAARLRSDTNKLANDPVASMIYLDGLESPDDEGNKEPKVEVVPLPKSGGVVPTDAARMQWLNTNRVRDYFFGALRELNPHNVTVPLRSVTLCKLTTQTTPPGVELWKGDPAELKDSLLAVIVAPKLEDVFTGNMAGLVWVRSVTYGDAGLMLGGSGGGDKNASNAVLQLLCPAPGPLISNYLLVGDINGLKYFEGT
ncbi:hypothetical protein FOL47_000582 [Perkinsus chesapeaki]|uniref:Uncharacterized protein n=1 Tax=Perkinsus chesapeaki TaxID=330153 RepID=A0A7J6MLL2_PERCH|nr:hypothetical protein FOL47_000582 [Perkinsus chesapeaki]